MALLAPRSFEGGGVPAGAPQEPKQANADENDAAVVNAAWVAMRQSREKLFLRDTFMHPERPRYRICREVGIKEHLYPEMLRRASTRLRRSSNLGILLLENSKLVLGSIRAFLHPEET